MGFVEIIIVASGLSLDSFAISVCTGLVNRRILFLQALKVAFVFGIIQGLAPVLGGLVGHELRPLLQGIDHWIALLLLVLVGGKMIYDGLGKSKSKTTGRISSFRQLLLMGVATSVDAVVVGVTFGLVGYNLWIAGLVIGFVTTIASMIGLFLGSRISGFDKMKLEIIAGIGLILFGVKIFAEHLINNI